MITPYDENSLEAVWPVVAHRLQQLLLGRGASRVLAEDLVQETALRVVANEVPFTSADDLLAWCVVVARRLHIDACRRSSRTDGREVPDVATDASVDEQVHHRLVLHAVASRLPELSSSQRDALFAPNEAGAPRREAVRRNVARHRARRHLLALIDGALALVVWLARRLRTAAGAGSAVTVAALVAAAVAVVAVHGTVRDADPDIGARVQTADRPPPPATAPAVGAVGTAGSSAASDVDPAPPAAPPSGSPSAVSVDVPVPGADVAAFGARPKTDVDEVLCVDAPATGHRCTTTPVVEDPVQIVSSVVPTPSGGSGG